MLLVDRDGYAVRGGEAQERAPQDDGGGDDLAYVIYTSGSTGRPKGVCVPQSAVINFAYSIEAGLGFTATDRFLSLTSVSFDVFGMEFYVPLLLGGSIQISPPGASLDGAVLAEALKGVTHLVATPSTWRLLLDSGWTGQRELVALCGGEAMPAELARRLSPRVKALWNMYGPTETTIWSAMWRVPAGFDRVKIGAPIGNTQIYVLDDDLTPVSEGDVGQICIGGDGVARGYLNRPELTAERFVHDPHSSSPDARMYLTGDLGRWGADGLLECLGRSDHQVKIRGHRIELGEIEALLDRAPGVRASVVSAREDTHGDKLLVAYVECEAGERADAGELRERLAKSLPEYMVPSFFVQMEALPLTPNGKVDRKALPEPTIGGGERAALAGELEVRLGALWREVLGLEEIGATDEFFALGGHSLRLVQLASLIRERLGADVRVSELFPATTVRAQASLLERRQGEAGLPMIGSLPHGGMVPASSGQERMWFLHRLQPESTAYSLPVFFTLRGPLNEERLRESVYRVAARHEALRTVFVEVDGALMQRVRPYPHLEWQAEDLADLPAHERQAALEAWMGEVKRRPFSLAKGPLVRAGVVRLGDEEHLLYLNIHHAVIDGWAYDTVLREVAALYAGEELGPMPLQMGDYARWERSRAPEHALEWWSEHLAGGETTLDLPFARPRPPVQSHQGASLAFYLEDHVSAALRGLCAARGVTVSMAVYAAFAALLGAYTGRQELLLGAVFANREIPELDRMVGFTASTVPLRIDLSGTPSFAALVERVRAEIAAVGEHADVPFSSLVRRFAGERDPSRPPLIQVLCASQMQGYGWVEFAGVETRCEGFLPEGAMLDLSLYFWEEAGRLRGALEYNSDLYEAATAERISAHFAELLAAALRSPEAPIADLGWLPASETRQMLIEWNHTLEDAPVGVCVDELMAEAAARSPETIALRFLEGTLTFGELDRRAAAFARRLRSMGVGRGSLVGVCLERSIELVVALVGVLKTGAAYVPIDPAYPPERITFVIEDARCAAVITQRSLVAALEVRGGAALVLVEDAPLAGDEGAAVEPRSPEDLAYVLYTSGSTGRPKGVCVTHASFVNLLHAMQRRLGFSAGDSLLSVTTASFDIFGLELGLPLVFGGELCLAPQAALTDPHRILELLPGRTLMQATPTTWRMLIEAGWGGSPELTVLCGGEAMTDELARALLERAGQVWNGYGPTETTIYSVVWKVEPGQRTKIGRPIGNTRVYVLDEARQVVPIGVGGELTIAGDGVSRGYLGRPDLTEERFVRDPFSSDPDARMYLTGDLVRWCSDGTLEYLGRKDHQVKIRGFRIELGEIESVLERHAAVKQAVVVARERGGDKVLAAYVELRDGAEAGTVELREHLERSVPRYMVPAFLRVLDALPQTPNGKVDRKALPEPGEVSTGAREVATASELEEEIRSLWRDILAIDQIGLDDGFFAVGGHSLALVRVQAGLRSRLGRDVPMVDLLQHPTIRQLARFLRPADRAEAAPARRSAAGRSLDRDVAIIGIAGRFPGADDIDSFWEMLLAGQEGIRRWEIDELLEAGAPPSRVRSEHFVPCSGLPADIDAFDAEFFQISRREAELMDPQHRVFLECAWHALEDAGIVSGDEVGVFAGCGRPLYLQTRIAALGAWPWSSEDYMGFVGNGADFLTTRVAYKLGLKGPAVTVQTACSTSLVAVHHAVESLRRGECSVAIAGGVGLSVLSAAEAGYVYEPGSILSPDGHCRPFDAESAGTVTSGGVALIVLRRLSEAVAAGDRIYAVIKGTAINNDGHAKIGFMAPSVAGQAAVIAAAHEDAGVSAASIGYIEAHGTGTRLGDPIEVRALSEVFAGDGAARGSCVLGSVKSNIGHVDAAAGVTGLIKAALVLRHGEIPPTLHFTRPNPEAALECSPFLVNDRRIAWPRSTGPRRAGVSAFGIGGTNAHVVLEAPPERPTAAPAGGPRAGELLVLSARSAAALERMKVNLAAHLEARPDLPLAEVAWTLQTSRRELPWRCAIAAADRAEAIAALRSRRGPVAVEVPHRPPKIAFLFPGGGTQLPRMGQGLYDTEPVYRRIIDTLAERLQAAQGVDLRAVLFPRPGAEEEAAIALASPGLYMPAIFATEVALGTLFASWGIQPAAVIGHSLGEYAAAHLAGVLKLEDAFDLVSLRSQLCAALPSGVMLSIPLGEKCMRRRLPDHVEVAAVNGPDQVVVAGTYEAIAALEAELQAEGIAPRRIHTNIAAHSRAVESVMQPLSDLAEKITHSPPVCRYISNVTGDNGSEALLVPGYWARHLRQTVRFSAGIETLLDGEPWILLEVGPGHVLSTLVHSHPALSRADRVLTTLGGVDEVDRAVANTLQSVGELWARGIAVDWLQLCGKVHRSRVPLPSFPFARTRFMIESRLEGASADVAASSLRALEPDAVAPSGDLALVTDRETSILTEVQKAWCEVLGGLPRPEDDFFALGGNSLMVVQLLGSIRLRFGVSISVHELLARPTLSEMARIVAEELPSSFDRSAEGSVIAERPRSGSSAHELLNVLRPGVSDEAPLFLIHPAGGSLLGYLDLIAGLETRGPIVAVRAWGAYTAEDPDSDFRGLALRYVWAIASKYPKGPLSLIGHSMGGALAVEVARGMRWLGREVLLTGMIDTPPPGRDMLNADDSRGWEERWNGHLDEMMPGAAEACKAMTIGDRSPAELGRSHILAYRDYRPSNVDGVVVYIRGAESNRHFPAGLEKYWAEKCVGEFRLYCVEGNHISMMRSPCVASICTVFNAEMRTTRQVPEGSRTHEHDL